MTSTSRHSISESAWWKGKTPRLLLDCQRALIAWALKVNYFGCLSNLTRVPGSLIAPTELYISKFVLEILRQDSTRSDEL